MLVAPLERNFQRNQSNIDRVELTSTSRSSQERPLSLQRLCEKVSEKSKIGTSSWRGHASEVKMWV